MLLRTHSSNVYNLVTARPPRTSNLAFSQVQTTKLVARSTDNKQMTDKSNTNGRQMTNKVCNHDASDQNTQIDMTYRDGSFVPLHPCPPTNSFKTNKLLMVSKYETYSNSYNASPCKAVALKSKQTLYSYILF